MTNNKIAKSLLNPMTLYSFMILLGVLSGLSGISVLQSLATVISEIYIRIFKCLSAPIIVLSIIVTLAIHAGPGIAKIWRKTLIYTVSTTVVAAMTSLILYLLIHPANINQLPLSTQSALAATSQTSYLQHIITLVPANFLSPFLENQVIGVLLIG